MDVKTHWTFKDSFRPRTKGDNGKLMKSSHSTSFVLGQVFAGNLKNNDKKKLLTVPVIEQETNVL